MSENYSKLNYFKKDYEKGPFAASVKIDLKSKTKKKKVKILLRNSRKHFFLQKMECSI